MTNRFSNKYLEDHFEEFQDRYPGYKADYIEETAEKMLGCAEEENGYAIYRCMDCGEEKVVPFSCKSSFCLSCARIRLEKWLAKIEDTPVKILLNALIAEKR